MTTRTRVDRARASAGIVLLALQQIEDELTSDDVTAPELAEILREFHREADPQGGFFCTLAQLLTVAARTAKRLEPERDGDASCQLHEAAALVTDNTGLRAYYHPRP